MHSRRANLTHLLFKENPSVDSHMEPKEASTSEPLGPCLPSNPSGVPPGPKFDPSKVPLNMQSQIVNGARTLKASTPIPRLDAPRFFWEPTYDSEEVETIDSDVAEFIASDELTRPCSVSK